jgi:hypothetical protein
LVYLEFELFWNKGDKNMKTIRIAVAAVTMLAILMFSLPVSAATTVNATVNGIEIYPGSKYYGVRYNATFVTRATGDVTGALGASVNYSPDSPVADGTNAIVGGCWSLLVTQNSRYVGSIAGRLTGGTVTWTDGTNSGALSVTLSITFGTGIYRGITGSGTFVGQLSHLTIPPPVTGTLQLVY